MHFSVVAAVLFSMATPLVTYACDMTGLIETAMTMMPMPVDAAQTDLHADCPCEGPMEELCGSDAADCAAVMNCHGESFDADACCASHPKMDDAVAAASQQFDRIQFALPVVFADRSQQPPDSTPLEAARRERAPPLGASAPIHILHSSLLL